MSLYLSKYHIVGNHMSRLNLGGFIALLKECLYAVILSYKTVFDNKQCRPLGVAAFCRVSYGSLMLAKVFGPRFSSIQKILTHLAYRANGNKL